MNRYRRNRDQYTPNDLGSLYVDKNVDEEIKKGYRPVIYIGGQMEHRLHRIENLTGFTGDIGHRLFNGSWFYEYPITGTKSNINAINFADNFVKSLEEAKLENVDVITHSYGGLIAARASKSPRIHKVVAIHPPILGTPLANRDMLLDKLSKLEKRGRMIAWIVTKVVNDCYGFEQDNAKGINDPRILNAIDFDKLTVVGSNIDREKEKNMIARTLYDLIYTLEEKESDGVVLFDEAEFRKYGINYIKETNPTNHFDSMSQENIKRTAAMTLEGFEMWRKYLDGNVAIDSTQIFVEDKKAEEYCDDVNVTIDSSEDLNLGENGNDSTQTFVEDKKTEEYYDDIEKNLVAIDDICIMPTDELFKDTDEEKELKLREEDENLEFLSQEELEKEEESVVLYLLKEQSQRLKKI